jgi:hypothetical protein
VIIGKFEVMKPILRNGIRTHLSIYWNSHTEQALEEVGAQKVLKLLCKGKEIAKLEQNLANRSLQFETNMGTSLEDPATTYATKADVDRLSGLLQNRTITAQDMLIKSLSAVRNTSKTPPKPTLPAVTAQKISRGRSTTRRSGGGKKCQNVTQNLPKSKNRTQNRSGQSQSLTTKKSFTSKRDAPPTHDSTCAVGGQ